MTRLPRVGMPDGVPAFSLWLRRVLRRPDVWVFLAACIAVPLAMRATHLRFSRFDQLAYSHLADSFGAGIFVAVVVVFMALLLRRVPPVSRRALGITWGVLSLALTAGLLQAFVWTSYRWTSWFLQGLILALFAVSAILTLVLAVTGLARGRDIGACARDVGRHWCTLFFYLLTGGYLLSATRLARPEVADRILLRMDVSFGFNPLEVCATWIAAHPWADALTRCVYPMLGLLIGGVAASLHFARDFAGLRRCLLAILLIALLGNITYWAVPAVGPAYAFPELYRAASTLPHHPALLASLREAALDGPERFITRPDLLRNVMPSLHVAFSLALLAAAWCHRRRLFWLWLPLGFGAIASTLTFSVHYLVDVCAAVPFTIFCWWLADVGIRRFPPTGDPPLPALAAPPAVRRRLGWTLAGSLALSLLVLVLWGKFAPIPPWLAWPAALIVSGLPAWVAFRLFRPARPAPATVSSAVTPIAGPRAAVPARLLAGAVFFSGGTALILEQVAEKYLSTLVGASRPAATIVLAVYFTGLALGAWLCPRRSVGAVRRLALLELFIGAWAALFAIGFFSADRVLGEWLATTGTSAVSLTLARTALAVLWLLPPTFAMGAELPTLAAVLAGHRPLQGRTLSRYYAINLAGAFAFTFGAPVLLFNTIGANGALWFAALLAAFVGVALWSGLRAVQVAPVAAVTALADTTASLPAKPVPPFNLSAGQRFNLSLVQPILWSFAAGFAFFALEVLWFHLIAAVCGASVYSFSWLLAAVLLALTLAAHDVARRAFTSLPATIGWLVAALAVSNALWPWAGRMLAWFAGLLALRWFWSGEMLKFAVICLIVLPPAFLLGRIFPLLLDARSDSAHVSRLSVANVLGCVGGALVTGFVLIPAFGAEHTLLGFALLAAAGWLALAPRRPFRLAWVAPGLAGLLLLVVLPPWNRLELTRGFGVYLQPSLSPQARLLWFAEDFQSGFVTVTATPRANGGITKTLLQNGKFEADDAGEVPAQVGFAVVAATHAPARDRALIIGAGSGQTASVIARLGFGRVDIVDLSPANIAGARAEFGDINAGVFDRANVAVHLEDGRNFLLRAREHYDLIQIELTSVWYAGATNLYSREFYALARDRLAPGGVLVQWVQLHHLSAREIGTILATARAVFDDVSVWQVGGQACLLASVTPQQFNMVTVSRWLSAPDLAAARDAVRVQDPQNFAIAQLLDAHGVDRLLHRYPGAFGINTDRNRWLEFRTPKYYLSRFDYRDANLRWLESGR